MEVCGKEKKRDGRIGMKREGGGTSILGLAETF